MRAKVNAHEGGAVAADHGTARLPSLVFNVVRTIAHTGLFIFSAASAAYASLIP